MTDAGSSPRKRLAVVLFNLGGPDGPRDVRPFLKNLFSDKAIIGLPGAVRIPLANVIATGRQRSARANYARMGGGSPILKETQSQADALQAALAAALPDQEVRVFIAMRYWAPLTATTAAEVAAFAPEEVLLAPLYPQYSTTTTGSSLEAWRKAYNGPGRVRALCCYPLAADFIEAHAQAIRDAFAAAGSPPDMRLLFSAHGLPQRVIEAGDPYQSHIEATAQAVAEKLGPEWDWKICYQSRVGPLKWLGPSTVDAMIEAAEEGLGVIVTPIAFVSEHIETLVELDHDYAAIATAQGCPNYVRVPALGVRASFIATLSKMLAERLAHDEAVRPEGVACQAGYSKCPYRAGRRH